MRYANVTFFYLTVLSEIVTTAISDADIIRAQITESECVGKRRLSYTLNFVMVLSFKHLFVFNTF